MIVSAGGRKWLAALGVRRRGNCQDPLSRMGGPCRAVPQSARAPACLVCRRKGVLVLAVKDAPHERRGAFARRALRCGS